jgi:hypothetical protein
LCLYPAGFRAAYSEAAVSDFEDLCAHLHERRGVLGLATAWRVLARDLVVSLMSQWLAAGAAWRILSFSIAALIYAGILLSIEPGIRCRESSASYSRLTKAQTVP